MKKLLLFSFFVISVITLFATDYLFIYQKDNTIAVVDRSTVDSVKFTTFISNLSVYQNTSTTSIYSLLNIDSITFGTISDDAIKIVYSGTSVSITNPYASKGVTITTSGADVTVKSTVVDKELTFYVSGTSTDGSLKLYSDYKYYLAMNGLTLTNANGPAINIQSTKKCSMLLLSGTTNTLCDGSSYASSTEDQKATLFSEGQLIIKGTGSLLVTGKSKHAICSDDYIEMEEGVVTVSSAAKDGIHTNDHFNLEGGTLTITATGDAVECEDGNIKVSGGSISSTIASADSRGLKADSTLLISGGTVNFTVTGTQSKGIRASKDITLSGGTITINTSGAAALASSGSGYEPSYCTAIKGDSSIYVCGSSITITGTGAGNKGLSADKDISITSGTIGITESGNGATYTNASAITDAYSACGIDADRNISIAGGTVTVTTSGTGSKGISADGNMVIGSSSAVPVVNVTNTATRLLISGTSGYSTANYAAPKCLKSDGIMTINSGTFTLAVSNPSSNCIDSDSTLYIAGGTIGCTVGGTQSKGIKSSRDMTLSGGNITLTTTGGVELETYSSGYAPAYCAGVKSDQSVNLTGSELTITGSGAAFKGISADANINMTAGTVKITSGGAGTTYKNSTGTTDAYSSDAFTTDGNISVTGGTLTTSCSGAGGKGLKATGTITIGSATSSPTTSITTTGARFAVTTSDYCHPKTMVADGAIVIANGVNTLNSTDDGIHSETSVTLSGGTNTITASSTTSGVGEGVEGPKIYISGGTNTITASNDGINGTYGTVSGGSESNDGSLIAISGGTTYVTGADAIDGNGNFTMTGGVVFTNGPSSGVEEFCDVNGTAVISGGVFVGCSSSGMQTSNAFTSSTQPFLFITTTLSTSTMYTVAIANVGIVSFKPKNGGGCCMVSAPQMAKGAAYTVYTGGSYTGATTSNNLYYGGTFSSSGATSKKTGNLSSSSVVNSISF